jgi:hypothetical protein
MDLGTLNRFTIPKSYAFIHKVPTGNVSYIFNKMQF